MQIRQWRVAKTYTVDGDENIHSNSTMFTGNGRHVAWIDYTFVRTALSNVSFYRV